MPIRLFIFDNRIDIVRPGHLPNNLTVEKIRHGNSIIRNPVLVSYASKGILPYRGLGSDIKEHQMPGRRSILSTIGMVVCSPQQFVETP